MGSLFSAAVITGAGVLPGPAAPVTSAASSACSSASVPALECGFSRWYCLCDWFCRST